MHIVDDSMETVHLYVVREEPKQPYTVLPILIASVCLVLIAAIAVYSGEHPAYEHKTLILSAQLLPPQTFQTSQAIIPTGIKTYPATTAHGILTFTNGSVIAQVIPTGFTVQNVATDMAVFVPAGSANGYGYATVAAHALTSGKAGNIPAYAFDRVEGSSVYIRNLSAFRGGRDGYSVRVVIPQDRLTAIEKARSLVGAQIHGLHYPCKELYVPTQKQIVATWRCQFITYQLPSYMHVTGVTIVGKNLLIYVWFLARPTRIWVK